MKDQASVGEESSAIKYDRALSLFTESVMKPDHDLRGCAHNQGCYDELMEIREHVLEYLKTLKEVTHHTNPDAEFYPVSCATNIDLYNALVKEKPVIHKLGE